MDFLNREITSKKARGKNVDILTNENAPKKYMETRWIFRHRNYSKKNTWKKRRFLNHRNYIKKSMWKRREFFDQRKYIEKVRGSDVEIRENSAFDVST